ncbi:MAG: hypothetical protein ACKOX6_08475 [Bdellovibrio sp.]
MRHFFIVITLFSGIAKAGLCNLNTLNGAYSAQSSSAVEVKNMPPVMSQDTIGICYSTAASTLLTAENCRANKVKDCSQISDKEIFSPLDLAQFGQSEDKQPGTFPSEIREGGAISNVTQRVAIRAGSSASEECMSLDKVLADVGGAKEASILQDKVWKSLKEKYTTFKKKCPTCTADSYASGGNDQAEELGKFVKDLNLDVKKSNQDVLAAFAQDTYEHFLYKLLYPPECLRPSRWVFFSNKGKVGVEFYPNTGKGNYDESIKNIKSVLSAGRPLALEGICCDKAPSEHCAEEHAVVVSGYRKVCNQKNECRDSLKVVNSWGQGWQNKNDGGWIDARAVLDSTFYKENTLSWFVDK